MSTGVSTSRVRMAALIVVGGLITCLLTTRGAPPARAAGSDAGQPRSAPRVLVKAPVRRTIRRVIRLPADVRALRDVTIYGRVAGYLVDVPVDIGSRVAAGALLARVAVPDLDAAATVAAGRVTRAAAALAETRAALLIQASLVSETEALVTDAEAGVGRAQAEHARAQADLSFRRSDHGRLVALTTSDRGAVSAQALDEARGRLGVAQGEEGVARAQVRSAEALVTAARARQATASVRRAAAESSVATAVAEETVASAVFAELEVRRSFRELRAPFAGVVAERLMDPGDFVRDGNTNSGATPIVRLLADARMRVVFHVVDTDCAGCDPQRRFALTVDGLPGREFVGEVVRVSGALDMATRTLQAEGELDNADGALRHGMFGRVRLDLEAHENALVVPAEAVTTVKRKSSVLVVEQGTVVKKAVKLGADDGLQVEILEGLSPTDLVIVVGASLVTPGEKVVAVPAPGA